ncbi:threonine-phosphate decarboxylase CobD [Roseibacterium beibuensis]|uniref:threonine-phosphate decarboxylase n=1 Tax=[Roseibacterium] beibuensis TaxID=1193142 RepID=A0ABP9LKS6_9RHOB|nr:threonine-phosphate decarboxylase CobD [Roseibacterium beibuensis]MCS6626000.1 threonine-phosphate decarboxylase CobD [Roseibacterium beibuensis]
MQDTHKTRDHGGGIDAAAAHYGGARADWLDLSTGINPVPYPIGHIPEHAWTALPDQAALDRLLAAARSFWDVPEGAGIVAANGASALIVQMPRLAERGRVSIPGPTYNEHAAAFRAAGWDVGESNAKARVVVHPNNPDGRLWSDAELTGADLTVIDESFCDTCPEESHIDRATEPGVVVLKSFGKFWGLAGLRLGFAIARPETCARLSEALGPWSVSGPALQIGAVALGDRAWAEMTRVRLARDAARLDAMLEAKGATLIGGTSLFRTYAVPDAAAWQDKLAQAQIWTRVFPYSGTWLRLGLPGGEDDWHRLWRALP